MIAKLIDKYTALVEDGPTEYWEPEDYAYWYAYKEILDDLLYQESAR